jgi:hypothetical protein
MMRRRRDATLKLEVTETPASDRERTSVDVVRPCVRCKFSNVKRDTQSGAVDTQKSSAQTTPRTVRGRPNDEIVHQAGRTTALLVKCLL